MFPVFRNIMLSCGSVDLWRCGEYGEHGECAECEECGEHGECGECGDFSDLYPAKIAQLVEQWTIM